MKRLSKKEEEIMEVLWSINKGFMKEILPNLSKPVPPYNTVLSLIRKLEKDELIDHKTYGKTNQYFPLISKQQYRKSLFSHLLQKYFDGSGKKLLSHFIQEENMDIKDIEDFINEIKELKK